MIKYIQDIQISGKALRLFYLFLLALLISQALNVASARQIRRDPFVPLVDKDGNIRKGQDLFVEAAEILPEIILKGILWDEKNPLAVVNGKVLSEGSLIPFEKGKKITKKIILKKINPESIILDYNEREFTIRLRKKEKE